MVSDMYKKKDAGAARAHISVFRKAEADIQTRRDRGIWDVRTLMR